MKARQYQRTCVANTLAAFETKRTAVDVLPTGMGKTIIVCEMAKPFIDKGQRVMFMAHRDELIQQASEKFIRMCGIYPDVEKAEQYADQHWRAMQSEVIVTSVQTQARRMHRFAPDDFGILFVDECHHATSPSYRKVIAYYRQNENLKVCGVTATPKRKDKSALGQVFECCPFEMYLLEAIESGWLVPLDQTVKYLESMDLSGIQVSKGDLNERQLNAVLEYEKNLLAMADEIYRHVGDRRCLIFCSSVAQAHRMCEILNRYETDCADFVCGETPVYNRRLMYQRFGQKEFRFLTNCNVLGEGFDDPGIEVVAMCKPTLSTLVYSQQLGRATRVLPGVVDDVDDDHQHHLGLEGATLPADVRKQRIAASAKPRAEILDFVGNAGKHSIVQAVDVLGGEYGSDVVDIARREAESSGKREDIMERLKRAKEKMERDAAEAERRKHILAKARYENRKVDPFRAKARVDAMIRNFKLHSGPPASDGQRRLLERHGKWREGMSKGQAGAVISAMKNGPCSDKQASVLRRAGMSTAFTMAEASKVIDVLAKNGWRWPAEHPKPLGSLRKLEPKWEAV